MQFQAFNKILIEDQKVELIRVGEKVIGYQFKIRYPSYRGTFLSCIEKLDFYMDGVLIDSKQVRFELNGKEFLLDQIKEQYKTYWFVLDFAVVKVLADEIPVQGAHDITVDMYHRIPYAGYDGEYMGLPSKVTRSLILE